MTYSRARPDPLVPFPAAHVPLSRVRLGLLSPGSARRFAAFARFAAPWGILSLALSLSACAEGKYPSLAQRPVERSAPATPPLSPVTLSEPLPPALAAELADLLAQAQGSHQAFLARRGETERLVETARLSPATAPVPMASGAQAEGAAAPAPPSDSWTAANESLAELDANRADLARALDRLERLYVDDRVAHAIADGNAGTSTARPVGAAISDARQSVLAWAQEEDAALGALKARLPE